MTTLAPTATFERSRPLLGRLLGNGTWGVADQALISASNLTATVLLARGLSQSAFGHYALAFSVLLLGNSVQQGLVTQPHNIIGPSFGRRAYRDYTGTLAAAQLVLSLLLAAAVLLGSGVAAAVGSDLAYLLLALAPTLVFWQAQEFVRRVLYTEGRIAAALGNDAIAYGGQGLGIAAMWWFGVLSAELAIWIMAATNAIAAVAGAWLLRDSVSARGSWSAIRRNWRTGKWLVGHELSGTWLCDGAVFYIAAAWLGPAAAGILQGVHTLFGPVRIVVQTIHVMLPIRLARSLSSGGESAMRAQTRATLRIAAPLFAAFCLVLALAAEPILRLVYGEEWVRSAGVLRLYALAMCLGYIAAIFSASLKARLETRTVFFNRLTAALIGLALGCLLIVTIGLHGAVLGMIVSYACLVMFNAASHRRLNRRHDERAAA